MGWLLTRRSRNVAVGRIRDRAALKSSASLRRTELLAILAELAIRRASDQDALGSPEYLSWANSTRSAVSNDSPPKKSPQSTPSQCGPSPSAPCAAGIPSTV